MLKAILIADPDEALATALRAQLDPSEFRVDWVKDGEEAEKRLQAAKPQLFVLELALPKIHGHSLLKKIKASGRLARLPVLVVSHRPFSQDKRLAAESGAKGYLVKPVETETVCREILRLLEPSA